MVAVLRVAGLRIWDHRLPDPSPRRDSNDLIKGVGRVPQAAPIVSRGVSGRGGQDPTGDVASAQRDFDQPFC
jgi:hypothetical protein